MQRLWGTSLQFIMRVSIRDNERADSRNGSIKVRRAESAVPRKPLPYFSGLCGGAKAGIELARPLPWYQAPTMSDKTCTLRTRKFITNRLLMRKQFVSPHAPLITH